MATKKKQRQPSEDLAATVADIISSPITKINLGFLNLGTPGTPDVSVDEDDFSRPMGVDEKPLGSGEYPVGVVPKPMERGLEPSSALSSHPPVISIQLADGLDRASGVASAPPAALHVIAAPSLPAREEDLGRWGVALKPMGLEVNPVGFTAKPAGAEDGPVVDNSRPMGLAVTGEGLAPRPMGDAAAPEESTSTQSMFAAEQLGTLFPASRVKRIRIAQEALSHVEEKVYDLLWGVKNQNRDAHRFAEFSLQRIANEGRLNIKTVRELLPRLIEKGFIAIEREADVRRNRPTQYRVFSYGEVLADQRRRKRFWVIRTGKGVFYAHPVSVGVRRDALVVDPEPMGLESSPLVSAVNPAGDEPEPMGIELKPMGYEPAPVVLGVLSRIVRESLNTLPDEPLLREMIADCRVRAEATTGSPATDEEIQHFTAAKIRVLRNATNLRNPLAVLRKAVPECFSGQPFMEFRAAEQIRRDRELQEAKDYQAYLQAQELENRRFQERQEIRARVSARHHTAQGFDLKAIAEDPEMDQQGREVAEDRMRRLGRFVGQGL